MGRRKDLSLCTCFVGPRGSGKTLTMTAMAILKMAFEEKKVWANYPIDCTYILPSGERKLCSAIPLNMESLYTFDKGLAKGIVCIDEVNLWSDSRRSMAITSRLINAILTLIRHRQLSFYFTTQNENWLDVRVRQQLDILIRCQDLAFRNPKYEFGHYIQLNAIDVSGYATGYPFNETQRTYSSVFQNGKAFWGCYDTESEFDVLSTQATKYKIAPNTKTIVVGDEVIEEPEKDIFSHKWDDIVDK